MFDPNLITNCGSKQIPTKLWEKNSDGDSPSGASFGTTTDFFMHHHGAKKSHYYSVERYTVGL
jgi:hypothetical protein